MRLTDGNHRTRRLHAGGPGEGRHSRTNVNRSTDEEIGVCYPRLFRTALRLTGSYEEAADMTQQAFAQALARWDAFEHRARRTTWLYGILLNCVRDRARRRSVRTAEPLDQNALRTVRQGGPDALRRAEADEERRALRAAIEALPLDIRSAFVLTVMDGYTYGEAAEILAVPTGTIASRVHLARRRLRQAMLGEFGEA